MIADCVYVHTELKGILCARRYRHSGGSTSHMPHAQLPLLLWSCPRSRHVSSHRKRLPHAEVGRGQARQTPPLIFPTVTAPPRQRWGLPRREHPAHWLAHGLGGAWRCPPTGPSRGCSSCQGLGRAHQSPPGPRLIECSPGFSPTSAPRPGTQRWAVPASV